MSATLFLIVFGLTRVVDAEIKMPTPPTPPKLPTVIGALSEDSLDDEGQDAFAAAIVRLDSVTTLINDLKSRLREIEDEQSKIRDQLPPATQRDRIYLQTEVDHKAYAIRRSLPSLPGVGRLTVRFVVNPEGQIEDIEIVSAPVSHTAKVRRAVSSWLFTPARKSGMRVHVRVTASIRVDEN